MLFDDGRSRTCRATLSPVGNTKPDMARAQAALAEARRLGEAGELTREAFDRLLDEVATYSEHPEDQVSTMVLIGGSYGVTEPDHVRLEQILEEVKRLGAAGELTHDRFRPLHEEALERGAESEPRYIFRLFNAGRDGGLRGLGDNGAAEDLMRDIEEEERRRLPLKSK